MLCLLGPHANRFRDLLMIIWQSPKKVVFPDFLMTSDYDLGEKSTPKSLGLLWSLADGYSCTYFA